MVRETRYLRVADLPKDITEESLSDQFLRFGKIQTIRIDKTLETPSAVIAFLDIKAATKAHCEVQEFAGKPVQVGFCDASGTVLSKSQTSRVALGGACSGATTVGTGGTGGALVLKDLSASVTQVPRLTTEPPTNCEKKLNTPAAATSAAVPVAATATQAVGATVYGSCQSEKRSTGEERSSTVAAAAALPSPVAEPRSPVKTPAHRQSVSRSSSRSSSNSRSSSRNVKSTSKASSSDIRPNLGIRITRLPLRSTDSSLRDGLFHEYKKHGKVTHVAVSGQGDNRQAVVSFKKHEDAAKALEASQGKLFFGAKIKVVPDKGIEYAGEESDDETNEVSEYSQKATRTLFVGNLEKDVSLPQLDDTFKNFGTILDIDIKKQGAVSAYAFVQYTDIASVVRAMRSMDGCHIGSNKIKLGFGKSMPTSCMWVEGLTGGEYSEKYLRKQFAHYGVVTQLLYDKRRSRALVHYDTVDEALSAFQDLKNRPFLGKRLQVDFASRDCQNNFKEVLEAKIKPAVRPDSGALSARNWNNDSPDERYDDYQGRSRYAFHDDGEVRKVNRVDRSRVTEETDKDAVWRYPYSRGSDEKNDGKRKRSSKDPTRRRMAGSASPLALSNSVGSNHSSTSALHLPLDSRSPSPSSTFVSHRKIINSGGTRGVSPQSSRPSRSSSTTPPSIMAKVEVIRQHSGGRGRSATPPTPTKDERLPEEPRPSLADSEERLRNGSCAYRNNRLYASLSGSEMVGTPDQFSQRGSYRDESAMERGSSHLPLGSSVLRSSTAGVTAASWTHAGVPELLRGTSSSSPRLRSRLRVAAVTQPGRIAVATSSVDDVDSEAESTSSSSIGSAGGELSGSGGVHAEQHELVMLQEKKQQLLSMIEQLGDEDDDEGGGCCSAYDDDGRENADTAAGGVVDMPSSVFSKLPSAAGSTSVAAADGCSVLLDNGSQQRHMLPRLVVRSDDITHGRSTPPLTGNVPAFPSSAHRLQPTHLSSPLQQVAEVQITGLSKLARDSPPPQSLRSTVVSRDDVNAVRSRRNSQESCHGNTGTSVRGLSNALQNIGETPKQLQLGSGGALAGSGGTCASSHGAAMPPEAKRRRTEQDSSSPAIISASVDSSSSSRKKKKQHHSDRSLPSNQPSKVHRVASTGTRSADDDGKSSTAATKTSRASRRSDPLGSSTSSSACHSHLATPAEIPTDESAFFTPEVVSQINDVRLCKCKLRAAPPDLLLPKFSQTVLQPSSPVKSKPFSPPAAAATTSQSQQPKSPPMAAHKSESHGVCDNDDGARSIELLDPIKSESKDLRTSGYMFPVSPAVENDNPGVGRISFSSPADHASHSDVEVDSSGSHVAVSSQSNVPGSSPARDDAADIEKRIRALDEKLRQAEQQHPTDPPKPQQPPAQHPMDIYSKYRIRKKSDASLLSCSAVSGTTLLPATLGQPAAASSQQPVSNSAQCSSVPPGSGCGPSAIGQSLLSRSSIFDHDIKRLENIDEKYEVRLPAYSCSAPEVCDVQQPVRIFKTKAAAKELPASVLSASDSCSTAVITATTDKPGSLHGHVSLPTAVFGRPTLLPMTELHTISLAETANPVQLLLPPDSRCSAESVAVPMSWQQLPAVGLLPLSDTVAFPPPIGCGYVMSPVKSLRQELTPDASTLVVSAAAATAAVSLEHTCVQPQASALPGSRQHAQQLSTAKLTVASVPSPLAASGNAGEGCSAAPPPILAARHPSYPSGDVASAAAGSCTKPSDLKKADGTKLSCEPVSISKPSGAVVSTVAATTGKTINESSIGLSKVGFTESDCVLPDKMASSASAPPAGNCCVSDDSNTPCSVQQQQSKENKSDKKHGSKKANSSAPGASSKECDSVKGNADASVQKITATATGVLPGYKFVKKEVTENKEKKKHLPNDEQLSSVQATNAYVQPTGDVASPVGVRDPTRPVNKDRCKTKGDGTPVAVAVDVKGSAPAGESKHGSKHVDQAELKPCGIVAGGSNTSGLSGSSQRCDKKKTSQEVSVTEEKQCTAARIPKGTDVTSSVGKGTAGLISVAATSSASAVGAAPATSQTVSKHDKIICSSPPEEPAVASCVQSKKTKEQLEEKILHGATVSKEQASKALGKRSHAASLKLDDRSGHERKDPEKKDCHLDVKKERPDQKKIKVDEKKEMQLTEKKEVRQSLDNKKVKLGDHKEDNVDEKKEPKVDVKKTQRTDDTKEIKSDDPSEKSGDKKEATILDEKEAVPDEKKIERKSGEVGPRKENKTAEKKIAAEDEKKGKKSESQERKLDDKKKKQIDNKKPNLVSQTKEHKEAAVADDGVDSHRDKKKKDKGHATSKKCSTEPAVTIKSKDSESPLRQAPSGTAAPPKTAKSGKSTDDVKLETTKLKAIVASDSVFTSSSSKLRKPSETAGGKRKRRHSSSGDEFNQHEKQLSSKKRAFPESSDDEPKTAGSRNNGVLSQPTEKTEQQKRSWMEEYAPFLVNESMYDKVKRRSSTLAQAKQGSCGSDALTKTSASTGDSVCNSKKSSMRSNSTGAPSRKVTSSRRPSVDVSASSEDETGADSDSSASVIGPSVAKRKRQQQQHSEASVRSKQPQRKRPRRTISSSEEEDMENNDAKEAEIEPKKKPLNVAPATFAGATQTPKKCIASKSSKRQPHATSGSASTSISARDNSKGKTSDSHVRQTDPDNSDEEQRRHEEESSDVSSTADSSSSSDESDGKASSLQKKKALAKMARLPSNDQQDGGDESIASSFSAVVVKKEGAGGHVPSKKQQHQQKQLLQKPQSQSQKQQPLKPKSEQQKKTPQDDRLKQHSGLKQEELKQHSGQKQPELTAKQPPLPPLKSQQQPAPQLAKQPRPVKQEPEMAKPQQQPTPARTNKKLDPSVSSTSAVSASSLEKRVQKTRQSSSSSGDRSEDSGDSDSDSSSSSSSGSGSSSSSSNSGSTSSSDGDQSSSDAEMIKEVDNVPARPSGSHSKRKATSPARSTIITCASSAGASEVKRPLVKSKAAPSTITAVSKRSATTDLAVAAPVASCEVKEVLAETLSASSSDSESDAGENESRPIRQCQLPANQALASSPTQATATQPPRDDTKVAKRTENAVSACVVAHHEKPSPVARGSEVRANGTNESDKRETKIISALSGSAPASPSVMHSSGAFSVPVDRQSAVACKKELVCDSESAVTPPATQQLSSEASEVDAEVVAATSVECSSVAASRADAASQPASPEAAPIVIASHACGSREGHASDAKPSDATCESEARHNRVQHVQASVTSPSATAAATAEVAFDGDASTGRDVKILQSESSDELRPVSSEEDSAEIAAAAASVQGLLICSSVADAALSIDTQSTNVELHSECHASSPAAREADAGVVGDTAAVVYRAAKNAGAAEGDDGTGVDSNDKAGISSSAEGNTFTVMAAPVACESAVIRRLRRPLADGSNDQHTKCHVAEELTTEDGLRVDVQACRAAPADAVETHTLPASACVTSGSIPRSSGTPDAAGQTVKREAEEWPIDGGGVGIATSVISTPPREHVIRSPAPLLPLASAVGTSGLGSATTVGAPPTPTSTASFPDGHRVHTPVPHRSTAGNDGLLPPSTVRTSIAPSVAVVSPRTSQTTSDMLVEAHFKAALKGPRERSSNAFMESLKVEVPGEKMFDNLTPGGASRSMFSLPSVIKVQKSDTPCVSPLSSLSPHIPASPAPMPGRNQSSVGLSLPTSQSPFASSSAAAFMAAAAAMGAGHHQHVLPSELSPLAPFIASVAPASALDPFRQQLPHHGLDSRSMMGLMQQPFFGPTPSATAAHYSSALMHHPVTAGAGVLCPPMSFVGQLPLQNPSVAAAAAAVMQQQQPGILDDPCGDLFRGHMAAVAAGLANPLQHIVDVGRMSQYHLQKQQERLINVLQRYPVAWKGTIALKSDTTSVEMRYVSGSRSLPGAALPLPESGLCLLRVAQRMRLEQPQLDGVARRMEQESDYSLLLVVPSGNGIYDSVQSDNMSSGFIQYLQQKEAAGIINVAPPGSNTPAYVVHIFPPCEFSHQKLREAASELQSAVRDFPHLVVVIATVA